jgi:putative methyltransferase (TIGR04325 family)
MRRVWLPAAGALRRGIERVLPPIMSNAVRYTLSRTHYEPRGWIPNGPHRRGWNQESVAAAQQKHWPVLVQNLEGSGPLGVSHLPTRTTRENTNDHNIMMSYGYVLTRAARERDRLSILDWGGGVGHYYLYSRALLPGVAIEYHCYDVPTLCRAGRRLQPDVQFHEEAADLAGAKFDLVISSSSLHYFENWQEAAGMLAQCTGAFLYIARLMTVTRGPSFVVRQRSTQGYGTEFQAWFLNREELLKCLERLGMKLVREFVFEENWLVRNAPEHGDCRGFLYERRR